MTILKNHLKEITIREHLDLGSEKAISYLPISTIKKVLNVTISEYQRLAHERGLCTAIVPATRSPIKSGTVHVFHHEALSVLLKIEQELLNDVGWPTSAEAFVDRISQEWLPDESPAMPVIKRAFGDPT